MDPRRLRVTRVVLAGAFLAAAAIGFAVQGWLGILLFPLALGAAAIGLVLTLFLLDLVLTGRRHFRAVHKIRAEVSRLPTEQLRAIAATPSHPHFGFAYATLAGRGIEVKPERRLFLEMLVSPSATTRGQGMAFLTTFYPEVRLPEGCSSSDSPEVWRERIAAIETA
jgi:hypothetical protein